MPVIRPISDLRNTNEISEMCHAKKEPIFITKNGYGDMVLMSMDTYDEIISTSKIDAAITEAEAEYNETGEIYDAEEAFAMIRRKRFANERV